MHRAAFGDHGVVVARLVDDLRGLVAKARESHSSPRGWTEWLATRCSHRACSTRRSGSSRCRSEPGRSLAAAAASRHRVGDHPARPRDPDRALRPGGLRRRAAAVLLTLRVRTGGRSRLPETVTAYPRRGFPGVTASGVRAVDERNARLLGDLLATRRRRASGRVTSQRSSTRAIAAAESRGPGWRVRSPRSPPPAAVSSRRSPR